MISHARNHAGCAFRLRTAILARYRMLEIAPEWHFVCKSNSRTRHIESRLRNAPLAEYRKLENESVWTANLCFAETQHLHVDPHAECIFREVITICAWICERNQISHENTNPARENTETTKNYQKDTKQITKRPRPTTKRAQQKPHKSIQIKAHAVLD
jgi:hypothetical protein